MEIRQNALQQSSRWRKSLLFVVPILFAACFAWIDTAQYRAALAQWAALPLPAMQAVSDNIAADMARLAECQSRRTENLVTKEMEATQAMRDCFVKAMPQTKTAAGAIALANGAAIWLVHHPDDKEVRVAALLAIGNGRDELLTTKPWSDLTEKTAGAHDRSVILKLAHGHFSGGKSTFNAMADELDKAEYAVRLPAIHNQQAQWRLAAFKAAESE